MSVPASKIENLADRVARNAIKDRSRKGVQHLCQEVLPLGILFVNRIVHVKLASIHSQSCRRRRRFIAFASPGLFSSAILQPGAAPPPAHSDQPRSWIARWR